MSADVCPVCGCATKSAVRGFTCGGESGFSDCGNAADLAIERAAEIERLKAMLAPKWTDRRAFQLSSNLGGLIRACQQIDRASGIIDRLTLIQNLADSLALADLQKGEPSFLEFLNQLCRDDRRNQSNQETKP